jgi:hypothetical protein
MWKVGVYTDDELNKLKDEDRESLREEVLQHLKDELRTSPIRERVRTKTKATYDRFPKS